MYVRVLGPIGAGARPDEIATVSGTNAAVLAHLALEDGRWISAETLVDRVWDDPPGSARNAIQVAVSKLRKQFGAELVQSSAHGYAVGPTVCTDQHEVDRLVAEARRQLEAGDAEAGAAAADTALSLFRGEPLAGLGSRSADVLRQAARELQQTARMTAAQALINLNRPEEAAAVILPACQDDALNEPAQLLRIEALAAAGRLAAALSSYHELRRTLADELGVDPSPAAQAVFARLLRTGPPWSSEPPGSTVSSGGDRATTERAEAQLTIGLAPSRATAYQPRAVRDQLPSVGTAVLTGPSGVGKTQVATGTFADSSHRVRVWVSASSPSSVIAAYADAADAVQRVDSSRPEKERARQFLAWLASAPASWLVVLDDITNPADLRGWWPPESRHGLVLATTQRRIAELSGEGRIVLDVGLYTRDESLAYLTERLRAGASAVATRDLVPLADALGHHPLALGLAAAVILDEALSLPDYRQLLETAPLSTSLPIDVRADGYPRSLQAAWQIALDRADRHTDRGASRLLEVLSMLDPAGAPEALIDAPAIQAHLESRATTGTDAAQLRPRTVLRALHQVSLTDHEPSTESRSIRTHALTGRLARERASSAELVAALRAAADALVQTWPEFPASEIAETLRSNASVVERLDAASGHQALWSGLSGGLPPLLELHGRSLMDAEQFSTALPYLATQRDESAKRLGALHLATIRLHNEIARARSLSGDPARARTDLTELLTQLRDSLGDDHPGTLITAMTRAGIGVEAGSPLLAIQEIEAILPQLESVLGHDHEVTLAALQDLANAYGESGEDKAISLYDDLIERWRGLVGDDHRRTLILRADRAYWLGHMASASQSEDELARVLPELERVLGPLDPNTLRARNNRAFFLTDHAAAFEEFTRLLAVRLEVLGPDHSDTLATRGNLANRRGMLGDPVGAAEDFGRVVADQERALGRENRFALLCRGYQARWLLESGSSRAGAALGARAVADLERVLGPDHPYSRRITSLLDDVQSRIPTPD